MQAMVDVKTPPTVPYCLVVASKDEAGHPSRWRLPLRGQLCGLQAGLLDGGELGIGAQRRDGQLRALLAPKLPGPRHVGALQPNADVQAVPVSDQAFGPALWLQRAKSSIGKSHGATLKQGIGQNLGNPSHQLWADTDGQR